MLLVPCWKLYILGLWYMQVYSSLNIIWNFWVYNKLSNKQNWLYVLVSMALGNASLKCIVVWFAGNCARARLGGDGQCMSPFEFWSQSMVPLCNLIVLQKRNYGSARIPHPRIPMNLGLIVQPESIGTAECVYQHPPDPPCVVIAAGDEACNWPQKQQVPVYWRPK